MAWVRYGATCFRRRRRVNRPVLFSVGAPAAVVFAIVALRSATSEISPAGIVDSRGLLSLMAVVMVFLGAVQASLFATRIASDRRQEFTALSIVGVPLAVAALSVGVEIALVAGVASAFGLTIGAMSSAVVIVLFQMPLPSWPELAFAMAASLLVPLVGLVPFALLTFSVVGRSDVIGGGQ